MVLSIKYSTILNKREAARIEYPAIGATSFVSIVVYLTSKGINEFVVFLCIVHYGFNFLPFYPDFYYWS
jgi:hypothetical protein